MCQMCCCGPEPGLGVIPLAGCPREVAAIPGSSGCVRPEGVSVLLSLGLWAPQRWTVRAEVVAVGLSRLSQAAGGGRAGTRSEGGAGAGKGRGPCP